MKICLSGVKGIAEIFLSIFKINFHIGKTLDHVVQVGLGGRDTFFGRHFLRKLVKTLMRTKDHPRSPQLTCRPSTANKPANTTWFCDVKSSLFRAEFRRHFLSCFLETFSRMKENRMKTLQTRRRFSFILNLPEKTSLPERFSWSCGVSENFPFLLGAENLENCKTRRTFFTTLPPSREPQCFGHRQKSRESATPSYPTKYSRIIWED